MSRPKSVKYGSGEVVLKNLTEEEKATVTKLLQGPETQVEIVETEKGFELKEELVETPMTHSALSMVKVGNMWSLITIKFNPEHKLTGVMIITPLHTNRNIAAHRFALEQTKAFGRQI